MLELRGHVRIQKITCLLEVREWLETFAAGRLHWAETRDSPSNVLARSMAQKLAVRCSITIIINFESLPDTWAGFQITKSLARYVPSFFFLDSGQHWRFLSKGQGVVGTQGRLPQVVPLWHADYLIVVNSQGPEDSERNFDLPPPVRIKRI